MLLTGAPITAQRAYEVGLVNRVVPADQLDPAIDELTCSILVSSSLTIRIGKTAFYDQLRLAEADAYQRAVDVITRNAVTHNAQEGSLHSCRSVLPHGKAPDVPRIAATQAGLLIGIAGDEHSRSGLAIEHLSKRSVPPAR